MKNRGVTSPLLRLRRFTPLHLVRGSPSRSCLGSVGRTKTVKEVRWADEWKCSSVPVFSYSFRIFVYLTFLVTKSRVYLYVRFFMLIISKVVYSPEDYCHAGDPQILSRIKVSTVGRERFSPGFDYFLQVPLSWGHIEIRRVNSNT